VVIEMRPATGARRFGRGDTEQCLARIADPAGEGARAFTRVYAETAAVTAEMLDRLGGYGVMLGPLAGMPVSIKDLFNVAGETTLAGSKALLDAPPATSDAEIVSRLRRAGAVIVGKTNMTEFAFSGLGLNPHYGTPSGPWRRAEKRIPGGSSAGGGVSVADGMAVAAIGTDTGGSVRIPAAVCGLVGFKPTARTVPLDGALPLSWSLDSIGPIAADVATCAAVYDVLSATNDASPYDIPVSSISVAAAQNYCLDGVDQTVAETYERALRNLSQAGAHVSDYLVPVFDRIPSVLVNGGLVAAEAYAWHRHLIETNSALYDSRVLTRILRGKDRSYADYLDCFKLRNELIEEGTQQLRRTNVVAMPTIPVVPPRIGDLDDDNEFGRVNLLVLRNPTIANLLDACSISIPCHRPGEAPVGLMLIAPRGSDRDLLAIARSVEQVFQKSLN
jgi:aspartyl-tRNA(Asn)/glutamyl-tRNA(Gln) amidotransferase subunit A